MPDSLFISNFDFEVTFGNKNLDSRDSDLSTGGAKNEDTRLILPCKELKTRGRRQNDPVDAIDLRTLRSGFFESHFAQEKPKKPFFGALLTIFLPILDLFGWGDTPKLVESTSKQLKSRRE